MNIQNDLEDQTVGEDEEDSEEKTLLFNTTMASGWVSKPQHASSKKLVKLHSLQLNKIIILLSVNCWKKMNLVVLELVLAVALTTQIN